MANMNSIDQLNSQLPPEPTLDPQDLADANKTNIPGTIDYDWVVTYFIQNW